MRYLLKEIQDYMETDDGFRQRAAGYSHNMKSGELAFMTEAILIIKGIMMRDMLSYKHTNSDAYDKDVAQRTYYNINEILDFLSSPEQWFRKKSKLKLAYTNIKGKVQSRTASGGKK